MGRAGHVRRDPIRRGPVTVSSEHLCSVLVRAQVVNRWDPGAPATEPGAAADDDIQVKSMMDDVTVQYLDVLTRPTYQTSHTIHSISCALIAPTCATFWLAVLPVSDSAMCLALHPLSLHRDSL